MGIEQAILTWIHLICASIWVGGSIFIGIVLAPLLKKMPFSLEERLDIMIKTGRRFNKIALPSLGILMITGIYNSHLVLQRPDILFDTNYGQMLLIKIILVISLVIVFLVHVKIINKKTEEKIMSKKMTQKQVQKLRVKIMVLGEITVVLSIAILFFASVLDSGI